MLLAAFDVRGDVGFGEGGLEGRLDLADELFLIAARSSFTAYRPSRSAIGA
jgi:hypothetical protein